MTSWDIGRDGGDRSVEFVRRWLRRVNQRHPWNHNAHFHGWILRNLPARRGRALDVGCGEGALLERLTGRFSQVVGIDADEGMAAAAARRLAGNPGTAVRHGTFADLVANTDLVAGTGAAGPSRPPAGGAAFDLVTMVAVLHHLDLDRTLAEISRLLAPGGRLLVVGLARVGSPTDLALDLVSVAVNPLVGMVKHPRALRGPHEQLVGVPVMPVKDPTATTAEVTAAARRHLPGASVRRRLFFRYTLRWDKPA